MTAAHETTSDTPPTPQQIDLYWRPGCGFCSSLRRGLDKLGLERVEHNIWDDPSDAGGRPPPCKRQRDRADGRGRRPGPRQPVAETAVAFLASQAPHLLPADLDTADEAGGKVGRFVGRVLGELTRARRDTSIAPTTTLRR